MKQFKRAIALLLVLVLVLSIFPSAVAAGTEDVPQGTLEPTNFPAEYGNLYIQWNRLSNAQYYTVQLYKHQGDGEQYVLLYSETLTASQVTTSPYKLEVTDWIKSYGSGDYMANIVIERKYTTPVKASIEMTVTQLATPTDVSVSTDGKVSWSPVDGSHGYEVQVTVGSQTQTYKVDQNETEVDASEFIQGFAGSAEALTVSASVKAYGNLDNEYRTVDSAFSAPAYTLPEQVGVLPTPVIANSKVVSEGGKLYVEYKLEGGSVGKEYIDSLTLTLENTVVKAQTYTTKSVDTTGRIEVTYLNDGTTTLPVGTYNAVITANPKYPDLNAPASSEDTVTYGVDPLDAPVLTVSDDASKLSWPAVELSQGTLDSTADYEVQYKEYSEEDWKIVSIPTGNAIQQDDNGFYVDLTTLIDAGTLYDFKVIANNNEDLTLGNTSSASIQIFKTVVPTEVKIKARNSEDKVFATWTAPAITEGIDHYQVDVYMDGVLKTSLSTPGVVNELDISGAIDAAAENKYTVKVIAIGQHLVNGVFYGDSVVSEESNSVTSGTVAAPVIEFETRAGASTSYYVYFAGKDATKLPANVEGYDVTITYVLASGATNTWTGVINDVKCDIAQLKNQNGSQFMTTSWGDYANAEFTVTAVALSTNTALHANSAEVTGTDTFELSDIGLELNIQVKTESGRTVVSWNEIPGASYYFYTVQKVGEKNFVGTVQVTEADITDYLTSDGQWIVTVNALAQDGSTVYVNGNKDIMLTVLAAPAVTINTDGDIATATWNAITGATGYDVVIRLNDTVIKRDAVASDVLSYSLTDLIKANGAGTYTVEVTAVGDGSEYITSLVPGKADIIITKLTAPGVTFALNAKNEPVVTITAVDGETVQKYRVTLYADGQKVTELERIKAGVVPVKAYFKKYLESETAVTFTVEVEAIGSLSDKTLTSAKQSAELAEKVGRLPMPTITTTEIQQTGGRLMVSYTLENNGVPLSQIERLDLVLKYTEDGVQQSPIIQVTNFDWTGSIDVGSAKLPAGEIEATLNVVPKYDLINTQNTTTKTLTYNVETLPAPTLTVSDDGYTLSWPTIEMSNGAAVDQIDEFVFEYKKAGDANWTIANTGTSVIVKNDDGTFSINLKPFLEGGNHLFRVTAYNGKDGVLEDPTFTASSQAEVTVEKLTDVTSVNFTRDDANDAVVASWTNSNTAGVAGYQVEVLKVLADGNEVVKSETVTSTTYTVPADVIDNVNQNTYTVRVKALGTKSYEDTFYADAEFVTSTDTLTSGQLPTPDTTSVAQEGSTLKLTVNLLDVNNNVGEIENIYLTKLTKGGIAYSGRVAGTISGTTAVFDIFELTEGSLSDGTWTATIEVVSKNTTLFNGGTYDNVTVQYGAESLRVTDLTVDTKTGEISWSSVPNADGYDVIVSYGLGNDWSARLLDEGDDLKYTITGPDGNPIVPGTTYTVKVRPYSNNAIQYPTDPDLATVKLCKLVAPTDTTVAIDASTAYLNWTKSTSPVGGIANYLVTAGTYSKTAGANATKLSIRVAGLLNNAAEDGTYTLTLQAIGKQATNGIYYVDSDVVTHSEAVYKGKIPVADLTAPNTAMTESFQLRWVAGGTLQFSFKLPASDGTEYGDKLIAAIDTEKIEVRAFEGSTQVGTYNVTYDQTTGTYVADVTNTNKTVGDIAMGPITNVTNLRFRVYLPTNYSLIAANTTAAKAMQVPDKGEIPYDNLTVDYTTGDFSFDVIDGVDYTITIHEKGSATYTELTVDAEGKVSLGSYTLTAGTTYEIKISATDTNNILTDSQTSFYLYRPTNPQVNSIANKTGLMTYTVDETYPSTTVVEYDEQLASYDKDTKTFTFNVAETVQTLNVTLKTEGLYDEDTNTYVLHASNTASKSVNFGMVPAFTMTPEAIVLQGSGETTVTYQVDSTSKMKNAADWTKATVEAVSSKGTANGVVTADSGAGTIVATFDKGQLLEGVDYTFTLTVPKKAAYDAVSADRVVVSDPLSYSTSKVTFDASVSETGYLSLTNVDEKIDRFYMSINDGTTTYEVTDNFRLTGNSEFNNALKNSQVKLTITAVPKDESVNANTVTLNVERLQTVTVELDKNGDIVVTDPNEGMGTYSVVVTGDTDKDKVTYTDTVIADDNNYGDDWKDDTWQTLTYTTTTSGGYEDGVYYLNATVVDKHTTEFYVGVLPELTLNPASGNLTKDADGKVLIGYTVPVAENYRQISVTVKTTVDPFTLTLGAITSVETAGTIDMTVVEDYEGYPLTTTIKSTPKYSAINAANSQTVEYTYNSNVLDTPVLSFDPATGIISWTAVDNAKDYTLTVSDTSDTRYTLTDTKFDPADYGVAAGNAVEFSLVANPDNADQYVESQPVTFTVYQLQNPTGASVSNKTGVLTFTGDANALTNGYPFNTMVQVGEDGYNGYCTEVEYDRTTGKGTATVTFDVTADVDNVPVTVTLTGEVDTEGNVYVIDAAKSVTVKKQAGKLPEVTAENLVQNIGGTTTVTFQLPEVANAVYNYYDWTKAKVTAYGGENYTNYITEVTGVTYNSGDKTISITFPDGLQAASNYYFRVTLYVKPNYEAVAGTEVVYDAGSLSTAMETLNLSGSYGLDGKVTLTPDANATSIVMSWVKDGTTSTKEYSVSGGTLVVDPLVDASIDAADTNEYTFTFVAKANGYADSDPYTIELAYTSAPVIAAGNDGKFAIEVPAGYQLVASVDGGSYQLVDTPDDIGAFLAKVYAAAGTTVEVDFKFVSEIATFSADSTEVNVLTITVSKLADPAIVFGENNDGTFTVTDSNTDPTGTLVVMVYKDGNTVGHAIAPNDEGLYTVPDEYVEYGAYTVTAVVEGEGYNAVAGTWTLSSETVEAEGNKLGAQLATPTGLKVTVSSGLLAWNEVENATGYEVKVGDAEPVTVTETKYTPTLAVGENTVTITAVTDDPAYSNSEAASVVLNKLPDLTGLTIGENGEVYMTHDSTITNPYADTTVTVKVTKADEYTDAWNAETKVVDFDTDAEVHTVTIKVSVAGKTYTNDAKEKVYLIRPGIYSQTIKVQAGKMPEFKIEDVITDGVGETVVTFVTDSTENLNDILDTEAVKNSFVYQYEKDGEGSRTWDKQPSTVKIDGNKLIVTLDVPTDTSGYKLTYSFNAAPVSSMAGYRGIVKSTDSITFNGNKLGTPTGLRLEMVDGTAYLMWEEVDGATGYTVTKNGYDASGDKVTDTQYSLNFSSTNAVTYKVIATAAGHTNSEAAVIYVDKVTVDEASLSFNATTPVNYSTLRVNYTLTGNGTEGATLAKLKTLLNFYSEDEGVTVEKTGTTAYTVSFADSYLDEQHTYSLKGYILGEYNGVWYYSTAVATSSEITVGKLAESASVSGDVVVTGKAQNVTVSLEDVLRTQVKTAATQVTVTDDEGNTVLESVGTSINTSGNMVLKFQAEQLVAGKTYTVSISLTPKYASSCTAVVLTCQFNATAE